MRIFSFRVLGLVLSISLITTAIFMVYDVSSPANTFYIFLIILFSNLFLAFLLLRLLILWDIKKIESFLNSWFENGPLEYEIRPNYFFSSFEKMDQSLRRVAARKQEEIDNLQKMSHFRREFIANISHELKTPLFSAQGFVHTLIDGAIRDKNVRHKFLKKAAKSLDRLDLLVQDLLTLSQIEIGEIKMHPETFDLHKQTVELVEQLEEQAEKKDVRIAIEPENKEILVYADQDRIHQVMNNLIINSIKYNKESGRVKINFIESENSFKVEVADTGEGIPEEDHLRIFERFYRVEKSRSRRGGGTGLGLAIVKHILEGHDTTIKVESKVGRGTTFSFNLQKGEMPLETKPQQSETDQVS